MDMDPPASSSATTPCITSTLASPPSAIRGRPRSTSISNGSPGPAPGVSIPLPSLSPDNNAPSSSPWAFKGPVLGPIASTSSGGGGWGHRPTLSVPSIVSPSPVSPGGVARGGRHRRTQSVSPPGFPVLAEGEVSGFAQGTSPNSTSHGFAMPPKVSSTTAALKEGLKESPRLGRKESPSRIGKIDDHPRLPTRIAIPRAESPKRGSPHTSPRTSSHFSPSTSPTGHGYYPSAHHGIHHHPSSHAALLSGIRSHALPPSPILTPSSYEEATTSHALPDAIPVSRRSISRSPVLTATPHSPPFGPTSPTSHHPSPLALEVHRSSPDLELQAVLRRGDAMDVSDPTERPRAISPPLLPVPSEVITRPRSGSIGRDRSALSSPASLAGMYAEQPAHEGVVGHRDLRMTPEEQHRVSPPLEASLFASGIGAPPMYSPSSGRSPPTSAGFQSGISLGFAPLPSYGSTTSPNRSPSSSSLHSPPLPVVVDPCFPDTSFPDPSLLPVSSASPSTSPTSGATSSSIPAPPIDLLPPPSPHRTPISLPLPVVAPAPLPPHLGGPPLHHAAPPRHKPSRSKLVAAAAAAAAGGVGAGGPSGHAPKKHSPLASPALNGDGDEEEERGLGASHMNEMSDEEASKEAPRSDASSRSVQQQEETVEQALEDAERTEMDLGVLSLPPPPVPGDRAPSPCGAPEHHETSSDTAGPIDAAPVAASPPRSGWDMDDASEDEEDEPTPFASSSSAPISISPRNDIGLGFESPPSSPTTTRLEAAHAALSGDLDLARIPRDRSVSPPPVILSTSPTTALQSISLSPDRGPQPQLHFAAEPHAPGDVRPFGVGFGSMDLDASSSDFGCSLGRGMEGEGEETSALGLDTHERDGEGQIIAIDEESLSALERIFICAKSEAPEERARVAHNLAEWMLAVDICEAAEYVLPLLAGLATDHDSIVKEVFAPQLDQIMWHFFSQCPLIELDHSPADNTSPVGSPVPSRYMSLHSDVGFEPSPTFTHFLSDDAGSTATAPSTSKTSPSNTEVSDVPRISATIFTSLLGALLTDQSSMVTKSTSDALVRFLCRLKGKPLPADSAMSSPMTSPVKSTACADPADFLQPLNDHDSTHHHVPYHLSVEARQVLEDEFITGIVLGLARLDDDEREQDKTMDEVDLSSASPTTTRRAESASPVDEATATTLVLSPEEEQIEDGWLAAGALSSGGPFESQVGPSAESWGEPLTSFFDDGLDRVTGSSNGQSIDYGQTGAIPSSSPMDPAYSSFSADGHADEESSIGKMVSMSLISAIANAECLDIETLVQQILPEVERMKSEPMFYVRKEAAQAVGCLARALPAEIVETVVLPLHAIFARDQLWHVRRAACLTLPAICKRLSNTALRSAAADLMRSFGGDSSRNVRGAALEVCGELVYLFYEDPLGVPDELLAVFLGQPTPSSTTTSKTAPSAAQQSQGPPPDDSIFTPLQSALDSPPETFYDESASWTSTSLSASLRDPDRPAMCAFNFPAVALTIGGDKWELLQTYHAELCRDKTPKVRQSLASSLHELAKIIGPDRSDATLMEPFSMYLRDNDHIQGALLDNIGSLLRSFGADATRHALQLVNEAWPEIKTWRRREGIAEELGNLGEMLVSSGAVEELLGVLSRAFKDQVAAVREKAGGAIPRLFAATATNTTARSKLCAFLAVFSEDASYRNRMTFTSCSLAAVRAGVHRSLFEAQFLPTLSRLARDRVVNVQLGVSRAIGEACRTASLYADPSERLPLFDILSSLVHSTDRDVVGPVAAYYQSDSPPPTPQRSRFDQQHGAREDDTMDGDFGNRLPMAGRSNPHAHGVGADDGDEDEEMAGEGDGFGPSLDDLDDMDMHDDSEPLSAHDVWTKQVEGSGDESFLEVSHR